MAERKCRMCPGWHRLDEPWPLACLPVRSSARSDLPMPMIISDNCEFQSMLDGEIVTSKRAYERNVRRAGYHILGDERIEPKAPIDTFVTEDQVAEAYAKLEQGYRPAPAAESSLPPVESGVIL